MDWTSKNELEYDWCISAVNGVKSQLQKTKNARWLILGNNVDSFFESVNRFLQFANWHLNLGYSIVVAVSTEDVERAKELFPFAKIINMDSQQEGITAEYCIYCGYTTEKEFLKTDAQYKKTLERLEIFLKKIANVTRRVIGISSSKVYNEYEYPIVASEGEFLGDSSKLSCIFARSVESIISENASEYVILRPQVILGAGLAMESEVTTFLENLIHNDVDYISAQTQYSIVYITDFLTALIVATVTDCANTVYNVSNNQATASLLEVYQLYLQQHFQDHEWNVKLLTEKKCRNYAINSSKLEVLGWRPLVDLKTMIDIEVKARTNILDGIWFTDGQMGKLSAIHSALLQILSEVDRICRKHKIKYFLAGGTLLGAVRHQGFIPWDDDLDIMMLRPDYERFLCAAREELPSNMFLQTPVDEPGDHYLISKIRLNDTVFSSEFLLRFPNLHNGIFVDIIAQDYTANSVLGQKIHMKLSLLARGLVYKKWSGELASSKKKIYVFWDLLVKIIPMCALERFQHWVLTLFLNKKERRYLYDSMGINISRGVYPAEWLSSQTDIVFENMTFPAPIEYDAYLKYLYGDYMRMVPVTQRKIVHTVPRLDLGPYIS